MISNDILAGRRACIVEGPLAGLQGIVVDQTSTSRVLMAVDSLQGVFVRIDQSQLAPLQTQPAGENMPAQPSCVMAPVEQPVASFRRLFRGPLIRSSPFMLPRKFGSRSAPVPLKLASAGITPRIPAKIRWAAPLSRLRLSRGLISTGFIATGLVPAVERLTPIPSISATHAFSSRRRWPAGRSVFRLPV